jgi:sterol desaturase/sphingolipid hydroxylase (fatty acid hydroxylase superfamily)
MNPSHLAFKLLPLFVISILIEGLFIIRRDQKPYPWQESLASLAIAVGHHLFGLIPKTGILLFAWQHRFFTIPLNRGWSILLLFFGIEFCYYWHHRASHRVRWLWATHAVHHSPQYLNFSAAYRLGWTSFLSGGIFFFVPLVWLGFDPIAVLTGLSLNLIYQFWIHTELIPKLGILEWVLNTPSHHRVHHASNPAYLDCNYGGVIILFDRLFGTFAIETTSQPPVYGLTHPIRSNHPLKIVFHEWMRLSRDIALAHSWQERLLIAFAPPDWKLSRTRRALPSLRTKNEGL